MQLVEREYALMDGDGRPTDVVALPALFARHNSQILGPPPA
jgi:hypothetical protein